MDEQTDNLPTTVAASTGCSTDAYPHPPSTGGGRGQGSYLEHRLVKDTDVVLKSVLRDRRLGDLR